MPPKKKIKVKATSTEDNLPGISLASGSIQSDEQATDRGIAMSLGYGRVNAVVSHLFVSVIEILIDHSSSTKKERDTDRPSLTSHPSPSISLP